MRGFLCIALVTITYPGLVSSFCYFIPYKRIFGLYSDWVEACFIFVYLGCIFMTVSSEILCCDLFPWERKRTLLIVSILES